MRFAMVLLLGACWLQPPPAPPPPPSPAPTSKVCEIRSRDLIPINSVMLSVDTYRFADLAGEIQQLDVTITGSTAKAKVETSKLLLEGDFEYRYLHVRTTGTELHDGWLEISNAKVLNERAGKLEMQVGFPYGLEGGAKVVVESCDRLTFDARTPFVRHDKPTVELARGTKLRKTPRGAVVGAIAKDVGVIDAAVVERRGDWIRVRLTGENSVIVWVPAAATTPQPSPPKVRPRETPRTTQGYLSCRSDQPLFANGVRVGTLKAGTKAPIKVQLEHGYLLENGLRDNSLEVKNAEGCRGRPWP